MRSQSVSLGTQRDKHSHEQSVPDAVTRPSGSRLTLRRGGHLPLQAQGKAGISEPTGQRSSPPGAHGDAGTGAPRSDIYRSRKP